jgi:uncharacterized membrane protein YkoI
MSIIGVICINLTLCYLVGYNSVLAQVLELRSDQENWNGSVAIEPKLNKLVQANTNITINDAVVKAEQEVGSNSSAGDVSLVIINGFLVYRLDVIDFNGINHRFIIDAGDGKILNETITTTYLVPPK